MQVSFATGAGSSSRVNEDFVAATPSTVVVLDGLSAPAELGTGCSHSTAWYSMNLGLALAEVATSWPRLPLKMVAAKAIESVAARHGAGCDLSHPGTPSSSIAMIRTVDSFIDYLVLFDSSIVFQTASGHHVICDLRVDDFAQEEHRATQIHRIGTPAHRQAVSNLVAAQRQHRNKPGGYWVAGAATASADEALAGSFPRDQVSSVVLMTDGISCLVDSYQQLDWPEFLSAVQTDGPQGMIERVRRTELTDPEGVLWPRYKAGDDATIAYCRFNQAQP